jgi:hypothetical protein
LKPTFFILASLSLTSCNLVEGTLYCAYKTPKAIEQWWMEQQPKR